WYSMLGYQPNEFPASFEAWRELLHPEEQESIPQKVMAGASTAPFSFTLEFRLRCRNGKHLWIRAKGKAVEFDTTGKAVRLIGTHTDIQTEKEHEQESHLLFSALEAAPINFVITDADGVIEYVNAEFVRITGYSRPEALGQNPRIIKSGKHDALFYRTMWQRLTNGEVWRGLLINKRKDGTLYEEDKTIAPVCDKSGRPKFYISASRDVTRERLVEKQLQQAQKMQALGTLAGGIAHDFNNILMAIQGYAELALEEGGDNPQIKKNIDQVITGASRASKLIEQILTFSRQRETDLQSIDPVPIFKETIKFLRGSLPSIIQMRQELEPDCGPILADPTQIHQIMTNLCSNAHHAMREKGGRLTISLKRVDRVPEHPCHVQHSLECPEGFACLAVEDTGCGIPPELQARVFEPFFTTKPQGEGTGMGLSTVQGIVYAAGGHIILTSELGKGTRVEVYLPRLQARSLSENREDTRIVGGHERILIVDDEEHVVDLLKSLLEKWGYSVTTCYNGQEALLRFEVDQKAYDLVLTDQSMPGMTGIQLAKRL
ncbi:MAG TPA: PAS domain-containing protein, partial [Candidatus Ozemobacteraceae bacterium]|nr:PAS domain-containing protein [Candidatus Ozemobacteraceae bacterium]